MATVLRLNIFRIFNEVMLCQVKQEAVNTPASIIRVVGAWKIVYVVAHSRKRRGERKEDERLLYIIRLHGIC